MGYFTANRFLHFTLKRLLTKQLLHHFFLQSMPTASFRVKKRIVVIYLFLQ